MTKISMINLFKPPVFDHVLRETIDTFLSQNFIYKLGKCKKSKLATLQHLTTNPYPFFKLISRSFPKPRKNLSTSRSLVP